jgi:isopropylmalate/homocitrate/citramalate synthase
MPIADVVKLIECPRDAWQGLKGQIPTDLKVTYLKALISAGFKHIDAVSFVSPNAVPQMADSEDVLKELDPPDDVEERSRAAQSTRWVFRIPSLQLSCKTINARRSKTRLRNWKK